MSKQGILQLQSSNFHTEAKPGVVGERKENPKKVICSPCVTILISKAPIDIMVQSQLVRSRPLTIDRRLPRG